MVGPTTEIATPADASPMGYPDDTTVAAILAGAGTAGALNLTEKAIIYQNGAWVLVALSTLQAALAVGNADVSTAELDILSQYAVPLAGGTVAITNGKSSVIIDPAGTLATLTITMPTAPNDGQEVEIATSQALTSITHTA